MRPEGDDGRVPEDEGASPEETDAARRHGEGPSEGASGPAPATWAGRARAEAPEPGDAKQPDDPEAVEPEGEPEAGDGDSGLEDVEPEAERAEQPVEPRQPDAQNATATGAEAKTVEADTLALADREQAQEAALAGLRARAAKKEPDADADETVEGGEEPEAEGEADAEGEPDAEGEKDEDEAAEPATAMAAPEPAAAPADTGEAPSAKSLWARFLAASLVIVISMATATAVSILVFLTDFAKGLGGIPGVSEKLAAVEGGDPQTILILGSDKRPTDDTGRSDTTILLRVDPDTKAIALLSIPRDLRVNIPGHGIDKFNAAYSYGGPKLTLEVVKQLTGLDVHHVVNINFTGFAEAVNAIGCVYIDVDRRYFIPPESGIAEIDIEAGYQRLCGLKALQYVRFRHEDTDLVRAARQQDFLREARQKIEPARLVFEPGYRYELLDIFKKYTTSDEKLENAIEVLEVMKTFVAARNAPLSEVHFPAQLGGPSSLYVTASEAAIKETVEQFLGTEGTPGPSPTEGGDGDDQPDGPNRRDGRDDGGKDEPTPKPEGPAMIDATAAGQQYAAALRDAQTKGGKPMLDFPVRYPTRLTPGSAINDATRAFPMDGPADDVYRGYKFAVGFAGSGGFTEYYGVSGSDWRDPPILENPSETREIDGRDYLLFYDGDRLRLVGWKQKDASYWVINTLSQTLEEAEMLSIATSLRELGG